MCVYFTVNQILFKFLKNHSSVKMFFDVFMDASRTLLNLLFISCSKAKIKNPCSENCSFTYFSQNHSTVTIFTLLIVLMTLEQYIFAQFSNQGIEHLLDNISLSYIAQNQSSMTVLIQFVHTCQMFIAAEFCFLS